MKHPTGIGLYLRALRQRVHGTPQQLAEKLKANGITWVAIGGPWHDTQGKRWMTKPIRSKRYAEALTKKGIDVHIWGYPWHNMIDDFVDDMLESTADTTVGWLLDPELGFKKRPTEAIQIVEESRAVLDGRVLGMTSYGMAQYHRTFPFEEFSSCDYGSPQLYLQNRQEIKQGIEAWEEAGFRIVIPSFGTYKFVQLDSTQPMSPRNRRAVRRSPTELSKHLCDMLDQNVAGMIGWSYNLVSRQSWAALFKASQWYEENSICIW